MTAALTRRGLLDGLRARLGLSAREADEFVAAFLEVLAEQLADGGAITLSGLGRFETRLSPSRPGRNPATGRPAAVPARSRPVFTASRLLRRRLLSGDGT